MSACQTKHEIHKTSPVKVFLKDHKQREHRFIMDIYDWQEYIDFKGNCIGKDGFSQILHMTGGYETSITLLWQQLLEKGNKRNLVVDFGAHIGWYTIIAALYKYNIACIEADIQRLRLLIANATYNQVQKKLIPNFSFIDEDSPPLALDGKKLIQLVKIDIGNSEVNAISMCMDLLQEQKINYVLVKINQQKTLAIDIIKSITDCGYTAYVIPAEASTSYSADPLKTLKADYQFDKVRELAYTMHQSYLFIKDKK